MRLTTTSFILLLVAPVCAHAEVLIPLGTATGGIAVYYNSAVENPGNVSYLRAQFGPSNTNGGAFAFDNSNILPLLSLPGFASFQSVFGDVGQFGFDLIVPILPSGPIPVLTPYDNVDYTLADRAVGTPGSIEWAINDYNQNPGGYGPSNPANQVLNSLLRGPTGSIDSIVTTETVTGFDVTVSGTLVTDGLLHWSDPDAVDTPASELMATGNFLFSGTLSYNRASDTTAGMDFYTGTIQVYAQFVPEPSTVTLAAFSVVGLLVSAWRAKRSARRD